MHLYRWRIPEKENGSTVFNAVRRGLPLMPREQILRAFARRDVRMDDARCRRDDPARPGCAVSVYTDFFPQIRVLYEDERVVVIHKPAGLCVEDEACGMTVLSLLTEMFSQPVWLCHRLDTRTEGVLLLARDEEAYRLCADAFAARQTEKRYECLVRGKMDPPEAVLNAYLVKDAQAGKVRVVTHQGPGALKITTGYSVLEESDGMSRLAVTLYTGRTHQIRAHMAFIGHPVVGDDLYGDRRLNRALGLPPLKLCSVELRLTFPPDGPLSYLNGKRFTTSASF